MGNDSSAAPPPLQRGDGSWALSWYEKVDLLKKVPLPKRSRPEESKREAEEQAGDEMQIF